MDSFKLLKRRTTDLISSIPQSLPSIQSLHLGGTHHHAHYHHHGTQTIKGTWEKIGGLPPLLRFSYSVSVVAGNVYIFGGESPGGREPVDNDVHVITLPSSGAPADYYTIKATPEPKEAAPVAPPAPEIKIESEDIVDAGGDAASSDKGKANQIPSSLASSLPPVPSPRIGHATASIGHRIFIYGGRGGPDLTPLDEGGRVWVFDTRSRHWSYLDPVLLPTTSTSGPSVPEPRSDHSAIATDKPRDFDLAPHHPKPITRTDTWKQWALGDSDEVGIPQNPIVGNIAARAVDPDLAGFGTLLIHGGRLSSGSLTSDLWAFDIHSRTWKRLPDAPGTPLVAPAMSLSRSRLYRFAGSPTESSRLDYLELGVDQFNDGFSAGEVSLVARGEWQSLSQTKKQDVGYKEPDPAEAPLTEVEKEDDPWPCVRHAARLEAVTVGGGREYLVLLLGEAEGGRYLDDVWAFEVPAQGMSAAKVANSVMSAVGRRTGEGKWKRVEAAPYDDEDDESADGPGPRAWFGSATMGDLEESGIVIWGGIEEGGKRKGDVWVFRLG
ncbi:nitrile-specifier protein 2 [Podospora aff. communis PSN243]|uniref:Nitrile-specifier protein 2 n=1 Tax=Podospora aff. communis PSN243 TaxID=3040156 RepID=A0AAV9GTW5_9PEZI|nr:nitrile-specifier protein 2 [Podospora aff. communis PSN243]